MLDRYYTTSIGPADKTAPLTMTATESHTRSMRFMVWLDITTVPPAATYFCRISITFAADTGSTDSNGSSSTRRRGACTRAQASAAFLVMPAL